VNDAEYRALDAVNYSTLKHIRKSPKHYKHALEHPDTSTNYSMLRAIHALVLEPFAFDEAFVVWEGRRDKRNKDYAAFLELHAGKDVLTPDEFSQGHGHQRGLPGQPLRRAAAGSSGHPVRGADGLDGPRDGPRVQGQA
jgi:hypothetical protein